jgi:hypothetical protein
MDKAILGSCRVGFVRVGVTLPKFDVAISVLEKQNENSPYIARQGSAKQGYARQAVKNPLWFKALKALEKV